MAFLPNSGNCLCIRLLKNCNGLISESFSAANGTNSGYLDAAMLKKSIGSTSIDFKITFLTNSGN